MAKDEKGHGSNAKGAGAAKIKPMGGTKASKEAVAVLGALRGGLTHPRLIAQKAGLSLEQARGHLREMHSNGIVDRANVKGSDHSRYTLSGQKPSRK